MPDEPASSSPAPRPRRRGRRTEVADAIRRRLHAALQAKGWSQREFAERMRAHYTQWSQAMMHWYLKTGHNRGLDVRALDQMATVLGVPLSDILAGPRTNDAMRLTALERRLIEECRKSPTRTYALLLLFDLVPLNAADKASHASLLGEDLSTESETMRYYLQQMREVAEQQRTWLQTQKRELRRRLVARKGMGALRGGEVPNGF